MQLELLQVVWKATSADAAVVQPFTGQQKKMTDFNKFFNTDRYILILIKWHLAK